MKICSVELLNIANIEPTICFTSYLKRAQNTLDILLKDLNLESLPVHKSWKLNERHYGALQGLNKEDVKSKSFFPVSYVKPEKPPKS